MPTPIVVRECHFTFKDLRGFHHTIRVHTTSLMRAAAHAMKELEDGGLLEGCDLVGDVEVEIVTKTRHTVQIRKVKEWLEAASSPHKLSIQREIEAKTKPQR